MKQTLNLLSWGFESSMGTTPEFLRFFTTFKKEFTKELQSVGATDIKFNRGHFYVFGFYTLNGQPWYFSISDVRGQSEFMFRKCKNYNDYTGETNQFTKLASGMAKVMHG